MMNILEEKKIKRIIDNTIQSFFGDNSQFVVELDEIFRTFTKGICLWDKLKVFSNLINVLMYHFNEGMKQKLPQVNFNRIDEISYTKFMLDSKFNVIFVQYCNDFFNDTAKDITKSYMDKLFTKMEGFYE